MAAAADVRLRNRLAKQACAITRDHGICQWCFETAIRPQAHHIQPVSEYPELALDPDNGWTMGRLCHTDIENDNREIDRVERQTLEAFAEEAAIEAYFSTKGTSNG